MSGDGSPRPNGPSEEVRARLAAATTQAWAAPGVIDLGIGQPDASLLPVELFDAAMAAAPFAERYPLQYGGEAGDGYLRLALAAFLAESYGGPVDPEPIFVTNGNSQAIELICSVFTRPGDVVFVEEPTYFLALEIFRGHGLRVIGVPVDDDGISTDALEALLGEHHPVFVYTIPAFQNPTGVTSSETRRRRLVTLAEEHGFLVVADEVYQLLDFAGTIGPPLAAHVDRGCVLSLGTFSKILAPGLRLGWIQAAPPLIERLTSRPYVVSGGGLNPFASAVVRVILEQGTQTSHLARVREVLHGRAVAMDLALREHFPVEVDYRVPEGGYFFWLRFPPGTDTVRWREPAAAAGVGFRPGPLFSTGSGWSEHLRLSFAFYDIPDLTDGLRTLGSVIRGG